MIKLSDLLRYERLNEKNPYWFLNQISLQVENIEEITVNFDISVDYFIRNCFYYNYVPLPFIDLRKIEKDFLIVLNNKKISDYLNRIPEDMFEYEFGKIFHCGFEYDHWVAYYKQQKKSIMIDWCKQNKIPYIDDIQFKTKTETN